MFASINRPGWRVSAVEHGAQVANGRGIFLRRNYHQFTRDEGTGTPMVVDVLRRVDIVHFAKCNMAAADGLPTGVDLGRLCLPCAAGLAAVQVLGG